MTWVTLFAVKSTRTDPVPQGPVASPKTVRGGKASESTNKIPLKARPLCSASRPCIAARCPGHRELTQFLPFSHPQTKVTLPPSQPDTCPRPGKYRASGTQCTLFGHLRTSQLCTRTCSQLVHMCMVCANYVMLMSRYVFNRLQGGTLHMGALHW